MSGSVATPYGTLYDDSIKEVAIEKVYEFEGELFENTGDFLNTLAREYKQGDRELVVDTLEKYGFTLADIGVRPEGM